MEIADAENKQTKSKSNSNFNLYLATCAIDTIGISIGCSLAWTSPTIPQLEIPNDRILITKEQSAWLGSLLCLGGLLGPFINISLVDRIGKKRTLFIYSFFMALSWVMLALFNQIEMMYVARFINGLAVGPASILVPMYIVEISSTETRGTTGSFFPIFIFFGCCIAYFLGPVTSYMTLVLVSAGVTFIGLIFCLCIPESPYYSLSRGLKPKAFGTLLWLRNFPDKKLIHEEVENIQETIDKSRRENAGASCTQCFRNWTNLKCFYYVSMIVFYQQITGFNAMIYYSQSTFQRTGSSFSAVASSMICGAVMLIASGLVPYISKILRIKYILCLSATGCSIFMGVLTAYFYLQDHGLIIPLFNLVPIISVIGFIISFTLGIGPYTGVIMVEILPVNLKVMGTAMLSSFTWFLSFVFTRFFPICIDVMGTTGIFGFFSLVSASAIWFIMFQLPDTQGLTFLEIQDLIKNGKSSKTHVKEKEKLYTNHEV